jgi:hypothetical protein
VRESGRQRPDASLVAYSDPLDEFFEALPAILEEERELLADAVADRVSESVKVAAADVRRAAMWMAVAHKPYGHGSRKSVLVHPLHREENVAALRHHEIVETDEVRVVHAGKRSKLLARVPLRDDRRTLSRAHGKRRRSPEGALRG